ncbi:MAG: hypothetical protein AB2693_32520, partial [Candidatus Thiodiazotropha sp.]
KVVLDLFPEWDSIVYGSRIDARHPSQQSVKRQTGMSGMAGVPQSTPATHETRAKVVEVEMEVTSRANEIGLQDDSDSNVLTQAPVETDIQTQAPVPSGPSPVSISDDMETNSVPNEANAIINEATNSAEKTSFKAPKQATSKSDVRSRPSSVNRPSRPSSASRAPSRSRSRSTSRQRKTDKPPETPSSQRTDDTT